MTPDEWLETAAGQWFAAQHELTEDRFHKLMSDFRVFLIYFWAFRDANDGALPEALADGLGHAIEAASRE